LELYIQGNLVLLNMFQQAILGYFYLLVPNLWLLVLMRALLLEYLVIPLVGYIN